MPIWHQFQCRNEEIVIETRTQKRAQNAPKKKNQKNNLRKNGKKKMALWKKILLGVLAAGLAAFLAGVGLFAYYVSSSPELDMTKLESTNSPRMFASNGDLIADLGAQQRTLIEPNNMPKLLSEAVVSVEDRRFYQHRGVDPIRIIGSALHNLTNTTTQGGSTLTQQLIKLSFFSTDESDQTLRRKAQEAWLAIQLERVKSKDEILALYMNKVNMSNRIAGMRTASQIYFGKEPEDLTLPEAALIAGMAQAPNAFNPYVEENQPAALERRNTVLLTMLNNRKISQQEYDEAIKVPITQGLQPLNNMNADFRVIDPYIVSVMNEVHEKTGLDMLQAGLDVYTNIDMNAQNLLYQVVNSDEFINYPDELLQIASTLVDVNTGKVIAQIGGRNIPADVSLGNNLATSTLRDWGSTTKSITDYAPAIENLDWPTNHMLNDAPFTWPNSTVSLGNWDGRFMGWMTMRRALVLSRNVPAAETLVAVGKDKAEQFLKGLGIQYPSFQYANAISSNTGAIPAGRNQNDYGISSEKMAAAYAAFANGGMYYKPYYVNKIVSPDGTTQTFEPDGQQAMKDTTAYMITDMLKDVITGAEGTGSSTFIPGLFQAGKTGTSNFTPEQMAVISNPTGQMIAPDVSFVGYTPNYSLAVWAGYSNQNEPITEPFFSISQQVYRAVMAGVSENMPNNDWVMPANLQRIGRELRLIHSNYKGQIDVWTPRTTTTEESTEETTTTTTEETTTQTTPPEQTTETTTTTEEPATTPPTTPDTDGENGNGGNEGDNQEQVPPPNPDGENGGEGEH